MKKDKLIERISRLLEAGEALEALTGGISPSDLTSLMLHVYSVRGAARSTADLLAQYERTQMVRPSAARPRSLIEAALTAIDSAEQFEAVELAPVAPLGLNQVLGQIDQNNCLAAVRNAEVLADPTTVKALEVARRRRAGQQGTIKLCAWSRQMRLQPFNVPGFSPHFGLFSMVTGGRDTGGLVFETESLREHIAVYLSLLRKLGGAGYKFEDVTVSISDTARDDARLQRAASGVIAPLAVEYPEISLALDHDREQARQYYKGLCMSINATAPDGFRQNLADGGFTDWTQRLLSNAKERLLVSGIGLEMVVKRFM
jgi:hypothetical protein